MHISKDKLVGWITIAFILGGLVTYGFTSDSTTNKPSLHRVLNVIDGDTIRIDSGRRVRLIGIDSPEEGDCFYNEATEALEEQIGGKLVRLDKDVEDKDRVERLLRYVVVMHEDTDNVLLNEYMLREGFARRITHSENKIHERLFITAENEAERYRRGMWSACDIQQDQSVLERREVDSLPLNESCTIKGNISQKGYGKTYILEGCPNYYSVKVDTSKGEKYFCTEVEAQEAGFQKAGNCE